MRKKTVTRITTIALMLVLLLSLFTLTGCNGGANKNVRIKSSYPEWIEAMNPELKNEKIYSYEETAGKIELKINNPDAADYLKILDNHTKFVLANPGYFPEDLQIVFCANVGGMEADYFTNRKEETIESDGPKANGLLTGAVVNSYGLDQFITNSGTVINSPCLDNVEILYLVVSNDNPVTYDWGWLDSLAGLKVLGFRGLSEASKNSDKNTLDVLYRDYPDIKVAVGNFSTEKGFEITEWLKEEDSSEAVKNENVIEDGNDDEQSADSNDVSADVNSEGWNTAIFGIYPTKVYSYHYSDHFNASDEEYPNGDKFESPINVYQDKYNYKDYFDANGNYTKREYTSDQAEFGTYDSTGVIFYDENQRPFYKEYYVTSGERYVFYLSGNDGERYICDIGGII